MIAFERDEYRTHRHIIVEKIGYKYLSPICDYDFEKYDTVEVIFGNKRQIGLLGGGSGYRCGTKTKNNAHIEHLIIGFAYVHLVYGSSISKTSKNALNTISDDTKYNKIIHVHPCRIVLIEKNIVGAYEKSWESYYEWTSKQPPIGG